MLTENDLKFIGAVIIKSTYPHFSLQQAATMSKNIYNIVFDEEDTDSGQELLHD